MKNNDANELNHLPNLPKTKIELPHIKGGEPDLERLWEALYKSVEPFGGPRERFAALIRAAYYYVDPYADDSPDHLGEARLVSLAKENHGQNNAYTDLQEMLDSFDKALGK
jgi:hypothetical protein